MMALHHSNQNRSIMMMMPGFHRIKKQTKKFRNKSHQFCLLGIKKIAKVCNDFEKNNLKHLDKIDKIDCVLIDRSK